jgi:hypothetical protein
LRIISRSENPDAGAPPEEAEALLLAWMRSRSVSVTFITFGDFTLPSFFVSYLKRLPPSKNDRRPLSTAHSR